MLGEAKEGIKVYWTKFTIFETKDGKVSFFRGRALVYNPNYDVSYEMYVGIRKLNDEEGKIAKRIVYRNTEMPYFSFILGNEYSMDTKTIRSPFEVYSNMKAITNILRKRLEEANGFSTSIHPNDSEIFVNFNGVELGIKCLHRVDSAKAFKKIKSKEDIGRWFFVE